MVIVLMNHNNHIEQPIDPIQNRKMSVERKFSKIFLENDRLVATDDQTDVLLLSLRRNSSS